MALSDGRPDATGQARDGRPARAGDATHHGLGRSTAWRQGLPHVGESLSQDRLGELLVESTMAYDAATQALTRDVARLGQATGAIDASGLRQLPGRHRQGGFLDALWHGEHS